MNQNDSIVKFILSIILFPLLFQESFIIFAWGNDDLLWIMLLKRLFLILPVFAIILGCWITIASLLTVIIRHNRKEFITALFITWWDLGKAVFSFWGGIFKFIFYLLGVILGFIKIVLISIWEGLKNLLLLPFSILGSMGQKVVNSPIPWIAVILTLFWCLIEGVIFTYVTTPLVMDTFSNITGEQLTEGFVRIPLFIFLLFIILGSYAVLSTFVESAKSKNFSSIIGIGVIELITLFVEVVFLYREFVDALVPWLAQYSEDFELGIFWTLAIASFVWFGIRSLSWFLFASYGTPTIMSVIQGKGLTAAKIEKNTKSAKKQEIKPVHNFMKNIKDDTEWFQAKGEELISSFMLPPLQVIAAAINFCSLLVASYHLFDLPFKNIESIKSSRILIKNISKNSETSEDGELAGKEEPK